MAQYVPTLNHYSGGLPIISVMYASSDSECTVGINLRPLSTVSHQQLVELADVEVRREYELVVTTYAGLSRYRVGDVLRVTGFHNGAPRFRLVRRVNVVLSVDTDKTVEAELQRAVDRASSALLLRRHAGAAVLDYTSRACVTSVPGHYVIYWELMMMTSKEEEEGATTGDGWRTAPSSRWRYGWCGGAPSTSSWTWPSLEAHPSASTRRLGAWLPRPPATVDLLDSRVISSHFSPRLPRWSPGERFDPEKQ
ncbi:hypothetical protein HU200_056583 [Digitaria exilis]|uniref:Uncharacterized protein n=1 Tax=Digitaria exilis TaxID=1010633 RepID=A0A835AGT8_9POAL|nr:hypothetical protein HU200_056583 [Digitaria exilis]